MATKGLDRTSIIIIAICIILLVSWSYIFGPSGLNWMQEDKTQKKEHVESSPANTAIEQTSTQTNTTIENSSVSTPAANTQASETNNNLTSKVNTEATGLPLVTISSHESGISVKINPNEGSIYSVELLSYFDALKNKQIVMNEGITPEALSIFPSSPTTWTIEKVYKPILSDNNSAVKLNRLFSNSKGQSFLLTQNWILTKNFVINYNFTITNKSASPLAISQLNISAGGIPPINYLSGDVARSESHMIDALATNGSEISVKVDKDSFSSSAVQTQPIVWLAVSNKYFANMLKPVTSNGDLSSMNGGNFNQREQKTVTQDGKVQTYWNGVSSGRIDNINIPANSSQTWNFQYYSGPKLINLLASFAPRATDIMHLAFMGLETIAQWLLYLLIFLKGIVGSYGWAIILLTVLVKLVFWPVTTKSNSSMKRMQKVQPMMKELKEKYKNDKQTLNVKMMELYKKEKVNPIGGCLPMIIQIPIFFALYWTLDGAIELRHAHFLWASNLAMPDTIGHISSLAINPWAILMAVTMLIQQKLTPMATADPMQAKMMLFMPLIMLLFLYNLPSGLTMYWTISQVLSIIQLLVNRYTEDKKEKRNKPNKKRNLKTV